MDRPAPPLTPAGAGVRLARLPRTVPRFPTGATERQRAAARGLSGGE